MIGLININIPWYMHHYYCNLIKYVSLNNNLVKNIVTVWLNAVVESHSIQKTKF